MSPSSSLIQTISVLMLLKTNAKQYFYSNDFTTNMLIELEIGTNDTTLSITCETEQSTWFSVALNATSHSSNRFGIIYIPLSTPRVYDAFLSSYDVPSLLSSVWSLDNEIIDDDEVTITISRSNKISSDSNHLDLNALKGTETIDAIWAYGTSTIFTSHSKRGRESSVLQLETMIDTVVSTPIPICSGTDECSDRDNECCSNECIWIESEKYCDTDDSECCIQRPITASPTAPSCSEVDECSDRSIECCTGGCEWGESEKYCDDDECCMTSLTPDTVDPCICENGIRQLELKYSGVQLTESIRLYSDDSDETICIVDAVNEDDIILCHLSAEVVTDITYFTITYDTGGVNHYSASADSVDSNICSGYFDTSCSRDIVGDIGIGCDDLQVIAWSDAQNKELCGTNVNDHALVNGDIVFVLEEIKPNGRSLHKGLFIVCGVIVFFSILMCCVYGIIKYRKVIAMNVYKQTSECKDIEGDTVIEDRSVKCTTEETTMCLDVVESC